MTREEYQEERKEMLARVHEAEDREDPDAMNAIMDAIDELDASYEDKDPSMQTRQRIIDAANQRALKSEPKPVMLSKYSKPIFGGTVAGRMTPGINRHDKKDEVLQTMKNNDLEKYNFYNTLLTNSAGTSTTLSVEIPSTVYGDIVRTAPGAFLQGANILRIPNTGKITIPVWAHDTVGTHAENEELAVNGDAPTGVEITHQEYAYLTSYSEQAMSTSAEGLAAAIHANLMESHNKAMDLLLLNKVAGLEYTPSTNEIQISGAVPTYAEFVAVAGLLGDDFTDRAQWYMNAATYYKWLCSLADTAGRPILDPSKAVEDQAFLGRHINLDSNIPADTVYFGDASALYLNHAKFPAVLRDDNFRKNAVDFKVCSVSGAAVVPGSFVKLDNLGA